MKRNGIAFVVTALSLVAVGVSTAWANSHNCTFFKPNLIVDENRLQLTKTPRCVTADQTFKIKITGGANPDAGDVSVQQKAGESLEISGNNSADADEILVTVSGEADPGTYAKYLVKVNEVGKLDPRVKVIGSLREYEELLLNEIEADLAEEYDVTLEEIVRLYRKYREHVDSSP